MGMGMSGVFCCCCPLSKQVHFERLIRGFFLSTGKTMWVLTR